MKMYIRFSTGYLTHFLDVGSYGAEYSEWCEDSIQEIIPDVESVTEDLMTELFEEVMYILYENKNFTNKFELRNFKFHSPKEYNFYNDTVDFDLHIDDSVRESILGFIEKERYFEFSDYGDFYQFIEENFKSSSGYINLCPENKDEFIESLYGKSDTNKCRALSEFITWVLGISNYEYQERFDEMMTDSEVYTKYILREEDAE